VLELLYEKRPSSTISVLSQRFDEFPSLSTAGLSDRDQLSVSFFEFLFGFLAFAPGDPVKPLSYPSDAAVAGAEDLLAQPLDLLG
jgi:hypothetical protein